MTIISEEYLQKYKDVICKINKNIKCSIKSLDENYGDIHLILYFCNRLIKSYKSRDEYFYFFYILFFIFNFFYFLLFIFLFFIFLFFILFFILYFLFLIFYFFYCLFFYFLFFFIFYFLLQHITF